MIIRIDRFLAMTGNGSRSQVKELLKKGRVRAGERILKDPSEKIDTNSVLISLDGQEISFSDNYYYMMNKPAGCVCANSDHREQTVFDIIDVPEKNRLFCVGRLDIDTEGLLIITSDGELSHRLTSPKKHVEKEYFVRLDSPLSHEAERIVSEGFQADDELFAAPARLVRNTDTEVVLYISEGKFHQVKRMMKYFGCEVRYLKRLSIGGLHLDETLSPGQIRPLTKEELAILGR